MTRRARARTVPLFTALIVAITGVSPPVASAPPDTAAPDPGGARADSVAHFDKGLALHDKGAFAAALAEFVEARRLYPLRNAAYQAGLCLDKLGRYDEALEQLEAVLRDFGATMPARVKENVQRKVVEMRGLTGELVIEGAEVGAAVTVDGLPRGEHPLLAPLRVAAGSHLVRVFKTGFERFEARAVVAGGKTERVAVRLSPLGPAGRLQVTESGGRALDVLVDGTRVGASPWEGPLSPGPHMVALRGEGVVGTPPVQVRVEVDRTARISLPAEELASALRVEPVPVNAGVAVDGVSVGGGVWEGRLHAGAHRVEVSVEGFLPAARDVTLRRDERLQLRVALERDPRSSFARRPSHFTLEATAAAAFAPLLGGDVASGCTLACSKTPGAGGYAVVRGGYVLGSGLAFGVEAGALAANQGLANRSASVSAVGHPSAETVAVADSIWIHAALAGAWAGFSFDAPFPIHLRLGAGGLFGSALDARRGPSVEPAGEEHPLRAVFVAPEVGVGLFVRGHVEIRAGVEMIVAFVPTPPSWSSAHPVVLDRAPGLREYATFSAETFAGPIVAVAPGVGASYTF